MEIHHYRNFWIENLYDLLRDKRINLKLINNGGFTARDIALLTSKNPFTFREV